MSKQPISRRDFVASSSAAAAAGVLAAGLPAARSRATDEIRIGLVGCGGRGTGAAAQSIKSSEGVRLVALGDVFRHKVDGALKGLSDPESGVADKVDVAEDARYSGLDAYKSVIHHPDVDLVLNATPPAFRPVHLAEAVAAGKHSFIEKPACVDPAGYRSILRSAEIAREKNLAIVTGTQFRRANNYAEAVQAIHEGAIGDVLFAQARYCSGGIWYRDRAPEMTDVEYQLNNWYHFVWLGGDQIVEQAVHNIDAINWAMGGPPSLAFGNGGQRNRPADSEIYDCMSIDYEYPNGATLSFMCRQQAGKTEVSNRIIGSKGEARIKPFGVSTITTHGGEKLLRTRYKPNSYVQEHTDLIASIRSGAPIVEAEEMAASSLTAVMGRLAAYTGSQVTWDFVTKESKLDLMPPDLTMDTQLASAGVARPGETKLV